MYGTQEPCVSALRGASLAYGQESYGAHHAVQWSTTPHDTEYRYRRYFLSLFLSYMNGIDQINTEEGCWRMEEMYADFERHSVACRKHASIQGMFADFVSTHTRRGKLFTQIAFVQGRYEAVNFFCRNKAWMNEGDDWKFSYPELSWDLLKIFYPQTPLIGLYSHNCPNCPQGFFTKTPYGLVDIIPEEADVGFYQKYKYLVLVGWNTADEEFVKKIVKFVEQGGTIILSWSALNTTINRKEGLSHLSDVICNESITELLGASSCEQIKNVVSLQNRSEIPQILLTNGRYVGERYGAEGNTVIENYYGKGHVLFVNSFRYPAETSVKPVFEKLISEIAVENAQSQAEHGWIDTNDWISTSVFDAQDRRVLYLLNVDWWSDLPQDHNCTFHFGDNKYAISLKRNTIGIITIFNEIAILTEDLSTDILEFRTSEQGNILRLQGEGQTMLTIFHKDKPLYEQKEIFLDGIQEIQL